MSLVSGAAVNIGHYLTGNCDASGAVPFVTCPDFAYGLNNCCLTPGGTMPDGTRALASSSLFNGLDTSAPPEQASVYQGGDCGTSIDAGVGTDLCLSTPAGQGRLISGANCESSVHKLHCVVGPVQVVLIALADFRPVGKRDAVDEPKRLIHPSKFTIEGRHFEMDEYNREAFYHLWRSGVSKIADMPEHLLQHENTTWTM